MLHFGVDRSFDWTRFQGMDIFPTCESSSNACPCARRNAQRPLTSDIFVYLIGLCFVFDRCSHVSLHPCSALRSSPPIRRLSNLPALLFGTDIRLLCGWQLVHGVSTLCSSSKACPFPSPSSYCMSCGIIKTCVGNRCCAGECSVKLCWILSPQRILSCAPDGCLLSSLV
jgi:hypothetical protein